MKPKLFFYLFFTFIFTFSSCGPNSDSPSNNNGRNTGGFHAGLVFPDNILRLEGVSNALQNIDCDEHGIAIIRFVFFDGADTLLVEDQFPCSARQAVVAGIPAGDDRRVVITAENQGGEVLLRGEESNITIRNNQTTQGGDIAMMLVSFTNDFGMTFNPIPAGTIMMGSPETELNRGGDESRHEVTLTQAFYMQTTEVTQEQWQAVMGRRRSNFQNCGSDCPVEHVSWYDVQEFLTTLNDQTADGYKYRLPTEAQWEYAARAESETAFCSGDITQPEGNDPILNTLGWYRENSDAGYEGCAETDDLRCIGPQPVGGKNPNAWGLFDMHGNVWEWCSDWYGDYPSDRVIDPKGPSSGDGRVLRGGSWYNFTRDCRSAVRLRRAPDSHFPSGGFRLAASLISR